MRWCPARRHQRLCHCLEWRCMAGWLAREAQGAERGELQWCGLGHRALRRPCALQLAAAPRGLQTQADAAGDAAGGPSPHDSDTGYNKQLSKHLYPRLPRCSRWRPRPLRPVSSRHMMQGGARVVGQCLPALRGLTSSCFVQPCNRGTAGQMRHSRACDLNIGASVRAHPRALASVLAAHRLVG